MLNTLTIAFNNIVRSRAAMPAGLAVIALMVTAVLAFGSGPNSSMPQSAPSRIAVVDVQKVLGASTIGKAAFERLKKMQDDRVAKAKQMEDDEKQFENNFNAKRSTISNEQLAEMQRQFTEKRNARQRYAQDADRELGEARDRELTALNARLQPIIDAMAKEMGLAVVFNKFESGLLYASDAIDITDSVVKKVNEATRAN
jgi:outer membrane protein